MQKLKICRATLKQHFKKSGLTLVRTYYKLVDFMSIPTNNYKMVRQVTFTMNLRDQSL